MNKTKVTLLCVLTLAATTLLSACGNKGPLYLTTDAAEQETQVQDSATNAATQKIEQEKQK